jgi:glycolate oxidase FAD binding subunit
MAAEPCKSVSARGKAGRVVTFLMPTSEAEAADIVADARARKAPFAIEGGGTRRGLGRPAQTASTLSTRRLTGVTLYEPAEMVISARAGTPLAEIEALLATKNQMLPFEPMDHRPLYGSGGEPTIGGVAACNISGPRRIQAGAARDHLLGVRMVNGRGEIIKSGGRVMKNVTGLDLVKLNCGAYGTLGLLTEVTFKALPRAPATGTLVFEGLDDARAVACMCAALGSPFEVSGAAHLPGASAGAQTLLRIEHFADSVEYRTSALAKLLEVYGTARRLDAAQSIEAWRDVRDVTALIQSASDAIWRISVAPTRTPALVAAISERLQARCLYDCGGGLIWLATTAEGDCGAATIRAAIASASGHATLVRAPDEMRARIDVFQPQAEALMKLTRGIKASFDPDGLFNPGRMYAGV